MRIKWIYCCALFLLYSTGTCADIMTLQIVNVNCECFDNERSYISYTVRNKSGKTISIKSNELGAIFYHIKIEGTDEQTPEIKLFDSGLCLSRGSYKEYLVNSLSDTNIINACCLSVFPSRYGSFSFTIDYKTMLFLQEDQSYAEYQVLGKGKIKFSRKSTIPAQTVVCDSFIGDCLEDIVKTLGCNYYVLSKNIVLHPHHNRIPKGVYKYLEADDLPPKKQDIKCIVFERSEGCYYIILSTDQNDKMTVIEDYFVGSLVELK